MVDSCVVFIRIVDRGAVLYKVVLRIIGVSQIWRCRIGLKERLNRRIDQRLRNLIAHLVACRRSFPGSRRKLKMRYRICGQRLARCAAAIERIADKTSGFRPRSRREGIKDWIPHSGNYCLGEISAQLGRRWNICGGPVWLVVSPAIVSESKKCPIVNDRSCDGRAELVLMVCRRWLRSTSGSDIAEAIACVKGVVAYVLERRAVKFVSARS